MQFLVRLDFHWLHHHHRRQRRLFREQNLEWSRHRRHLQHTLQSYQKLTMPCLLHPLRFVSQSRLIRLLKRLHRRLLEMG